MNLEKSSCLFGCCLMAIYNYYPPHGVVIVVIIVIIQPNPMLLRFKKMICVVFLLTFDKALCIEL